MTSKRLKTAGTILVVAGIVYMMFFWGRKTQERHVIAAAGTAVVVPYKGSLMLGDAKVVDVLDARSHADPDPLPGGLELLGARLDMAGKSAFGEFLIWVPDSATGHVEFELWASARGREVRSDRERTVTGPRMPVRLEVKGRVTAPEPPSLTGTWREGREHDPLTWTFHPDGTAMDIGGRRQDRKEVAYRFRYGGGTDWFLAMDGAAYRIEVDGDEMTAWPLSRSKSRPHARLTRQEAGRKNGG